MSRNIYRDGYSPFDDEVDEEVDFDEELEDYKIRKAERERDERGFDDAERVLRSRSRIRAVIASAAIGVAVLTALPAGATPPHNAVVLKQVKAIIAAANAQVDKDNAEHSQAGVAAGSRTFAAKAAQLRALHYPANARADAKALEAVIEKLSYDLHEASVDGATAAISAALVNDAGTEQADRVALESDLSRTGN
jgi:hypothetical protein